MAIFTDEAQKDDGFGMLCEFLTKNGCNPFDSLGGALAFRLQFTKIMPNSGAHELQHAVVVQKFFAERLGNDLRFTKESTSKVITLASNLTKKFKNKMKYAQRSATSFICVSLAKWKEQTKYEQY